MQGSQKNLTLQYRGIWLFILTSALLLLSSCSRIGLAYHFFPWYLRQRAAKYLNLNEAAQTELDHSIDSYVAWNRKTMCPRYAAICWRLAKGLRGEEPLQQNISGVFDACHSAYQDSLDPLISPTAKALLALDSDGIDHLAAVYQNDDKEERKRNLDDPEAAKKRRSDRSLREIENVTGSLNPDQEVALRSASEALPWPDAAREREREEEESRIIRDLRAAATLATLEGDLRHSWLDTEETPAAREEDRLENQKIQEYFAKVCGILNPLQREAAAKAFDRYADAFEALGDKT